MDKVFEEFNSLSVVFELPEKRLLLKATEQPASSEVLAHYLRSPPSVRMPAASGGR